MDLHGINYLTKIVFLAQGFKRNFRSVRIHIFFQAMATAEKIYYTSKPLYYYRQLSTSATGNVNNICSENYRSKYTETYEHILNEFDLN